MRNKPKPAHSPTRRVQAVSPLIPRTKCEIRRVESSEEQFHTLIQDLHVGVALLDADAKIEFANKVALKMFGLSAEQTIGKRNTELGISVVYEDGSQVPFPMRPGPRVLQSGQAVRGEIMGVRPVGSEKVVWIYGDAVPQFTAEGVLRRVLFTMTDITERKNAKAELDKTNELNRKILSSVQEGVVVHNHQLRYQLWNPFMERMTGLRAQDVIGKHPLELFPFLREQGALAEIEKALAGEFTSASDVPYDIPQTGEKGWCDNKFAPLRNEKNEIVGVIATVRDVTGRKRHEDELHQLSSRLLELQDEERRRIARDLHDGLAQHLMAASLNLAQLGKSPAASREKREKIVAETRGIVTDCARQTRSLSYLLHPPILDELGLASAIEEYADGFSQRTGIRVEVVLQPNMGRLPQEIETALFRIVQESLGNIQKHSGSDSGSIQLSRDDTQVTLEIRDSGKGIPNGEVQNHTSGMRRLGVGILGMRERMRQLGGSLQIFSQGSGTSVRAILPLKREAHDVGPNPHSR
ncbi:MAG: PAS domain-containing sensor histidine kinase [Candidatus Acidiferrales bacterium]